jgi:CHAD domain-containing protein
MRALDGAASGDGFHEWRKRAKDHRYHLEILRNLWPAPIKARHAEVKTLGDLLGDEHDLTALRATLTAESGRLGEGGKALMALALQRQAELRAQTWPSGLRLYAEPPKALVRRYRRYWQAWQRDSDRALRREAA